MKRINPLHVAALAAVAVLAFFVLPPPRRAEAGPPPAAHYIAVPLNGTPIYLGRIDPAGASETNAQAATPFATAEDALEGKVLLIQPDVACDIAPVKTSTGTVTAANAPLVQANERVIITMAFGYKYLAAICTGNVDVWELK